jgi:uncharacterized membrane protein
MTFHLLPCVLVGAFLGWIYSKTRSKLLVAALLAGVMVIPYFLFVIRGTVLRDA